MRSVGNGYSESPKKLFHRLDADKASDGMDELLQRRLAVLNSSYRLSLLLGAI
jgi:hypothetical protein